MSKDISKNKVFASVYKDEIEKRLAIGASPRSISKWLEARGEQISYATINEYKKHFFNTEALAGKIVKQKQEELKELESVNSMDELEAKQHSLLESQRNMAIAEIRAINHVNVLYENIQDMREYLHKLQSYEPVVAAHAARGLYAEMRMTIETLEKLKEKEGSNDDSSVARLLSSLKKQKRELENQIDENNLG